MAATSTPDPAVMLMSCAPSEHVRSYTLGGI
jgi:hypothetical protein